MVITRSISRTAVPGSTRRRHALYDQRRTSTQSIAIVSWHALRLILSYTTPELLSQLLPLPSGHARSDSSGVAVLKLHAVMQCCYYLLQRLSNEHLHNAAVLRSW
eukprot:20314-Heterococcus_DN1.PRE.7